MAAATSAGLSSRRIVDAFASARTLRTPTVMRSLPLLLTTLLASAPAVEAYALSCALCSDVQAPTAFTALPANFELRVRAGGADQTLPTLQGPGEPQLACDSLEGVDSNLLACRAASPLTPGATYTIEDGSGWIADPNLTVVAEPDHERPPIPTIVALNRRERSEEPTIAAGAQTGIDLAVTSTESVAMLSLEVELSAPNGDVLQIVAATGGVVDGARRAFVGQTFCQCDGFVDDSAFADDLTVRVRFVDAAGNRGPWSTTAVPEPDPEASGCTCAALPAQVPWAAFVGLAFAAYVATRRRR